MYRNILIPIDGSSCSELATQEGLSIAKAIDANVTFIYVLEDPVIRGHKNSDIPAYVSEFYEHDRQMGQDALDKSIRSAMQQGVRAKQILLEKQDPATAILKASSEADLIVIVTHGHRGFKRAIFGSVAESVIRHVTIPCLIVREENTEPYTEADV